MKKRDVIGVVLLCAFLALPAYLIIDYRMVENPHRKRQAVAIFLAGRERYPELQFGWSPRRGSVIVRVSGATDPKKQLEIKDWITSFKNQNGMDVSVRLEFYDADMSTMLAAFDDL
jgi:hypothetical protein